MTHIMCICELMVDSDCLEGHIHRVCTVIFYYNMETSFSEHGCAEHMVHLMATYLLTLKSSGTPDI